LKSEEVSLKLLGSITQKDIRIGEDIYIKKGSILSTRDISYLKKMNVKKVLVSKVLVEKPLLLQLERFVVKSEQPLFWEEYIDTLEQTKKFFKLLENGAIEDPEPLLLKMHNLISLLEDKKEFFKFAYSVIGCEDSLYRHSINVSILSYIIGEITLLEKPILLSQMGYLHDIGKVRLDQEILYKEVPLTFEEKLHVQKHTTLGVPLLKSLGIYNTYIQEAVLYHHENRKGDGYPNRLDSKRLPHGVQIISFIDALDTLCSDRVYKTKTSFMNALNILYFDAVSNKLNPLVVFSFVEYIFELFTEESVLLSDGRFGQLYHLNPKEIIRPIVKLENDTYLDLSLYQDLYIHDFKKNN